MPRVKRKQLSKTDPLLSDAMLEHLRSGSQVRPAANGNLTATESDVREAWDLTRDDLIAEHIDRQPGSRPMAFWTIDFKGEQKQLDECEISQAEVLHAGGYVTDEYELASVEYLLADPIGYFLDDEHAKDGKAHAMHAEDDRRPFGGMSDDELEQRHFDYLPYSHDRFGKAKRWMIAHEWRRRGLPGPSRTNPNVGIDYELRKMDAISSNVPSTLIETYTGLENQCQQRSNESSRCGRPGRDDITIF